VLGAPPSLAAPLLMPLPGADDPLLTGDPLLIAPLAPASELT
jgi:hypothetical protein